MKSIEKTAERIQKRTGIPDEEKDIIIHMLNSIVEQDRRELKRLKKKNMDRFNPAFTHVVGALKDTVNQHGPITKRYITSAAKRIINQGFPKE